MDEFGFFQVFVVGEVMLGGGSGGLVVVVFLVSVMVFVECGERLVFVDGIVGVEQDFY